MSVGGICLLLVVVCRLSDVGCRVLTLDCRMSLSVVPGCRVLVVDAKGFFIFFWLETLRPTTD